MALFDRVVAAWSLMLAPDFGSVPVARLEQCYLVKALVMMIAMTATPIFLTQSTALLLCGVRIAAVCSAVE